MSNASYSGIPNPLPGQGGAGATDLVTQLRGIIQQLSSANANMLTLIAAVSAIKFPQTVNSYIVANLPATPAFGTIAAVTDGTSGLSWGNTVTGGHSTRYLVWFNGSVWSVIGE